MKHQILLVFIFILGVVFVSPQFFVHYPSLIDDASDYSMAKLSYPGLFIEELFTSQRTWPLRLLYRKLLFDTFGINMGWHYVVNGMVLGVLLVLMFSTIYRLTKHLVFAACTTALFLFLPPVVANFYRLGTGEILQVFCCAFFVLLYINQRYWLAIAVATLSLFTKESSIFLTGVFSFVFLLKKRYIESLFLAFSSALYAWLILNKIHNGGQYIQKANFSIVDMCTRGISFISSHPTLLIMLSSMVVISLFIYKKSSIDKMLFWGMILGTLIVFFIWPSDQTHYLLPIYYVSYVYFALISYEWVKITKHGRPLKAWGVFLLVYLMGILSVPSMFSELLYWHKKTFRDAAIVKYLLTTRFDNTHVYSFETDYEANDKIWIYATKFNSEDVEFYPNMEQWSEYIDSPDKRNQLTQSAVTQSYRDDAYKILIIPTNYMTCNGRKYLLCAQSPLLGKQCGYTACESY